MGPYDIDRQYARMESVRALLSRDNLPQETRDLWTRVLNNIALDEDTYNMRVMWVYRNHKRNIIEY